ncbi:MAG: hypothetical protein DRH97_06480 [Chloroflexi bacterium]|nr:MAG: hypothetical protein DRH97_06480 [Chloroflexota bacterium]
MELALLDCALSPYAGQERIATTQPLDVAVGTETTEFLEEVEAPAAVDPARVGAEAAGEDIAPDFDHLRSRWKEFIRALRGEGSSGNLDAFLRSACDPVALEDDILVLGFYYSFHKEKIEDAKYRHLVERKLKEVFGRPYKIRCVLVDHKREVPSEARTHNPVVKAALEMVARISEVEI